MKEYIYYWYHHMMPSEERKEIEKVLNEKDYFKFVDIYKKYSIESINNGFYDEEFCCWSPMIFLPTQISVWDGDEHEGYVSILEKENFEKITFYECECG